MSGHRARAVHKGSIDKPLDRLDDENKDQGREIKPSHLFRGNESPDRVEKGFGHIVHEPDDGVIRIRSDPGKKGPNDDNPGKRVKNMGKERNGNLLDS